MAVITVEVITCSSSEVPIINSLEMSRLIDNAFARICHAINDLSMKVRAQSATLLVGSHFFGLNWNFYLCFGNVRNLNFFFRSGINDKC